MSKDKKKLNIFSPQIEAIVFIILQIFFVKRAVLKIGPYLTDSRPIYHRQPTDIPPTVNG